LSVEAGRDARDAAAPFVGLRVTVVVGTAVGTFVDGTTGIVSKSARPVVIALPFAAALSVEAGRDARDAAAPFVGLRVTVVVGTAVGTGTFEVVFRAVVNAVVVVAAAATI
jgi:hypothetical protein